LSTPLLSAKARAPTYARPSGPNAVHGSLARVAFVAPPAQALKGSTLGTLQVAPPLVDAATLTVPPGRPLVIQAAIIRSGLLGSTYACGS